MYFDVTSFGNFVLHLQLLFCFNCLFAKFCQKKYDGRFMIPFIVTVKNVETAVIYIGFVLFPSFVIVKKSDRRKVIIPCFDTLEQVVGRAKFWDAEPPRLTFLHSKELFQTFLTHHFYLFYLLSLHFPLNYDDLMGHSNNTWHFRGLGVGTVSPNNKWGFEGVKQNVTCQFLN